MRTLKERLKDDAMMSILLLIKDGSYISKLSREGQKAYYYCSKIVHSLEKEGIVKIECSGRVSHIILTDKGKLIKDNLAKTMVLL